MAIKLAAEGHDLAPAQSVRDERPRAWGGRTTSGPDGGSAGTSGATLRVPWRTHAGVALFIFALLTVNIFTVLHDAGGRLATWIPFVTEYTAAAMILVTLPAVAMVALRTTPGRGRWLRFALVHIAGSIVFCAVVVGGFVVLRSLIFVLLGRHYVFGGPGQLVYEYRRVTLAYGGMVVAYRLSGRPGGPPPAAAVTPQPAAPPARTQSTFDIRDGAKLIRAPVDDILSVRSAGNYVEFCLGDGRRLLMRATLSSIEEKLKPHGFLRTHRSWLINQSRLRSLEPEGSGDWRVVLDGGEAAPLSRRYPEALALLRQT